MVKRLYKFPEILFFQEGPGVRNHQYTTSGVKLLNVSNLRNGKIDLTTSDRYISENEAFNKYSHFLCDPNDFIIASSGIKIDSFDSKMGFIHQSDLPVCMNTSTIRFKVLNKEVLEIRYFMYYLKSIVFKKVLTKVVTGSAQLNFGPSHLKNMSISLPNLDIQKTIVQRLDRVNNLIEIKRKLLFLLDELVKSRFVELFGDIDCNTKNWPIITLENLAELITDGEHSTPKRCSEGIYLLSARNILNHSLKLDDVDYIDETEYSRISKRVIPKAGDILLSCSGSVGRCCVVPLEIKFQLVRSVALIRFKSEITPIFAEYMITSDWFQRQINSLKTASSQANLFQGRIKKLKGFVPDIYLQYEFIKVVNQINKLKSDVQKSIDETQLLMDSLMQEYFG